MYNTDEIYEYIKKNGEKSFEEIWSAFKDKLVAPGTHKDLEIAAKTRLYMSLLETSSLLLNREDNWDLKENYTLNQIKDSSSLVFKQDSIDDLQPEDSEDTKELEIINLEVSASDDDPDDEK